MLLRAGTAEFLFTRCVEEYENELLKLELNIFLKILLCLNIGVIGAINNKTMSCLALIGGVIGCGKSTLINYLEENTNSLFLSNNFPQYSCDLEKESNEKLICKIVLDELCSIEEQSEMMKSLKGWKCFRADLLMAAEHFINSLLDSKYPMHGPLTDRSSGLLQKLTNINRVKEGEPKGRDYVFLSEDNFYYRSMRYEWFQLARRANIGFCEVFLHCPLNVALSRNSTRGYNIPEEKIKRMLTFIEYPEPEKCKWEKFSVAFDSSDKLELKALKPIISLFEEAANNPAEMMIMSDKVQAQSICSNNIVHQADKVLRKSVSQIISSKRATIPKESVDNFTTFVLGIRQKVLTSIKNGGMRFSTTLLDKLNSLGIDGVREEFENAVTEKFVESVNEQLLECGNLDLTTDMESQILLNLREMNLNDT